VVSCLSRRDVALANYVAHELHCSRNTVSCQQCDVRLMKDRLQEHIDECHVDVKCDKCQTTCNKNNLLEHQVNLHASERFRSISKY